MEHLGEPARPNADIQDSSCLNLSQSVPDDRELSVADRGKARPIQEGFLIVTLGSLTEMTCHIEFSPHGEARTSSYS